MREEKLPNNVPVTYVHTLVIGSGASGLAAAVRLRAEGVEDTLIVTEGLDKGTSINTGSDKQTYYKLSLYGADEDAPLKMAESLIRLSQLYISAAECEIRAGAVTEFGILHALCKQEILVEVVRGESWPATSVGLHALVQVPV